MRTLTFFAVLFFLIQLSPVVTNDGPVRTSIAVAQEEGGEAPAVPVPDVDIEVEGERTTTWVLDPAVLIIGGIVLLVIVLIALASRGGGTTIVRER